MKMHVICGTIPLIKKLLALLKQALCTGLGSVGVALVASAAKSLTYATCTDRVTMTINAAAAVVSFYYPATWIFPATILAGGLTTLVVRWRVVSPLLRSPVTDPELC